MAGGQYTKNTIHKKGSVDNVQNYRGITLLSTLGKLFTRILNNRLNYWSDTYHFINDNQSGFRQGISAVDNIYILQSVIDVAFNRDKKVFCASIDFSKAFDYINRDCPWYKLLNSGIRGNIFNIIKSMYMNTFSKVKYQGAISDQFECNIGVKQGQSISPSSFNIFLNDLDSTLALGGFQGITEGTFNLRSLMYADNVLLLSNSREDLQAGLDCFYDYCLKWKLPANTTKHQ